MPSFHWQSRAAGLRYVVIPKCACTGNQIAMVRAEWEESHPELVRILVSNPQSVHDSFDHKYFMNSQKMSVPIDWFRYTFVRDPHARFLSFYNDKVLGVSSQKNEFGALGFSEDMTLMDALDHIESIPREKRNNHFAHQVDLIFVNGELVVDFIGRMERFEHDIHVVISQSKSRIRKEWFGHFNKSRKIRPNAAKLDGMTRKRIRDMYREDFRFFGYD